LPQLRTSQSCLAREYRRKKLKSLVTMETTSLVVMTQSSSLENRTTMEATGPNKGRFPHRCAYINGLFANQKRRFKYEKEKLNSSHGGKELWLIYRWFQYLYRVDRVAPVFSVPFHLWVKYHRLYKYPSLKVNPVLGEILCEFGVMDKMGGSVGIAKGYGLNGWGSIPGKAKRFYPTRQGPHRLWGRPTILSNMYRGGDFIVGKAARSWSWPLTSI
jgi:hypothetical protein